MAGFRFYQRVVLSLSIIVLGASMVSAEGFFNHPTIGDNPHDRKIERENTHHRFQGKGEGSHRSFSRGHHSPFSAEGLKETLELSDDQDKKMRVLLRNYRKGVILEKANVRVAQIELDASVADGNFEIADIEKKAKEREAAATALTMVRVHALADAKSFLSKDQFRQFMANVAHTMSRGGHGKKHTKGRHGRSGHGGKSRGGHGDYE
ncbi:MAG: hypothetical protein ACE5FY_07225 [Nitrospiria bacterium]